MQCDPIILFIKKYNKNEKREELYIHKKYWSYFWYIDNIEIYLLLPVKILIFYDLSRNIYL